MLIINNHSNILIETFCIMCCYNMNYIKTTKITPKFRNRNILFISIYDIILLYGIYKVVIKEPSLIYKFLVDYPLN